MHIFSDGVIIIRYVLLIVWVKGVSVSVIAAWYKDMNTFPNRTFKGVILAVAIVNIVVMILFGYGLPSPVVLAEEINSQKQTSQNTDTGTIESVEKENAAKEAEALETALFRDDSDSHSEEENGEESEENETQRDPDAPILELTEDHIFLHVGDRFNYMSYIETMEDVDGSDLSRYIHLDQDVDTSVPGEIELTYRITSVITGKSDSKVLIITIEE